MSERTSYPAGTFCWIDLSSRDLEAALPFYKAIFGWDIEAVPVVGTEWIYHIASQGGKTVAGLSQMPQQQIDAGAPSSWNSYALVEDAAASEAKAVELGASIIMPVVQVGAAGKMGFIADPQGAIIGLWEAGETTGAQLVNEPYALCWNEIRSHAAEAAKSFYSALFGWTFANEGVPGYDMIYVDGNLNGGLFQLPEEMQLQMPSHAAAYIAVADIDKTIADASSNGGKVVMPKMETPAGPAAAFADPAGSVINVIQLIGEL